MNSFVFFSPQKQLKREPRKFPKLIIKKNPIERLEDLEFSDFELVDYKPHGKISMEMSV